MIKVKVGFREDQFYVISDEEAHKAYYLFTHPEERSIFDGGIALIGKYIQGIEPAYNETMGWNTTHELDSDDWNEIRKNGTDKYLRLILEKAKEIAELAESNSKLLKMKLTEIESSGEIENKKNLKRIEYMKKNFKI